MQIKNVKESSFQKYGRIIEGFDVSELMEVMEKTPIDNDVIYVAEDPQLQNLKYAKEMKDIFYGGLEVQTGYCNGHNQKLNAFEYHRCSEINVACTDMILILGKQQDIESDFTYNTKKAEAFFIEKGTVVEIYATTLHYAPCGIDGNGFRCVVVLPKGTNCEIKKYISDKIDDKNINSNTYKVTEYDILTASNKWLIAHKEAGIEGAFNGLLGENITV